MPVPARITMALDLREMYGAWVDEALGGAEPMVDDWEAGKYLPTPEQLVKLAKLTGMPIEFFYRPAPEETSVVFVCDRRRRGENGLTVVKSSVDWDGVLEREEVTPPRSAYRPRKAKPVEPPPGQPAPRLPPGSHDAQEDRSAPGCCVECGLPMNAPNRRHTGVVDGGSNLNRTYPTPVGNAARRAADSPSCRHLGR